MKKKKLAAILLVIFTIISTNMAGLGAATSRPATFLALGDSISTGYGLADYSVTDMIPYAPGSFVELLKSKKDFVTTNLAYDGLTTSMLAEKTSPLTMSEQMKSIVQSSDIISVTIGGNDLLSTLYVAMASAMGGTVNPGTPEGLMAIQAAIIAGATGSNLQLTACLATAVKAVSTSLPSIAAKFGKDLTQVITNIKILNPTSSVVVQTIANPYKSIPGADALVGALDAAVTTFNTVISVGAQTGAYKLVDVYTAFKNSSDVLTNATNPLMPLDPHPNAAGHAMIANLVFDVVHVHTEGEWIIDKAPSYTEEGIRHTACTVCKETIKSEVIAKLLSKGYIIDPSTGIRIEYADGSPMDETIIFALTPKSNTEINSYKERIDKVAKGCKLEALYDMKLMKDGVVLQPDNKIKVTVPMTDEMQNMLEVNIVYIDKNGAVTITPSEIVGDNIIFTTDHLGSFGIIGNSKADKPNSAIPNTGDTTSRLPMALLAIVSGVAFFIIGKKQLNSKQYGN